MPPPPGAAAMCRADRPSATKWVTRLPRTAPSAVTPTAPPRERKKVTSELAAPRSSHGDRVLHGEHQVLHHHADAEPQQGHVAGRLHQYGVSGAQQAEGGRARGRAARRRTTRNAFQRPVRVMIWPDDGRGRGTGRRSAGWSCSPASSACSRGRAGSTGRGRPCRRTSPRRRRGWRGWPGRWCGCGTAAAARSARRPGTRTNRKREASSTAPPGPWRRSARTARRSSCRRGRPRSAAARRPR